MGDGHDQVWRLPLLSAMVREAATMLQPGLDGESLDDCRCLLKLVAKSMGSSDEHVVRCNQRGKQH